MISVSVSDLESFRQYLEDEDFTVDELLSRLRREQQPTEQMLAGTALHKMLEYATDGELESVEVDGFTFQFDCEIALPVSSVREMSITKEYETNGQTVLVRGRVDEINGTEVVDHKTTGNFDCERFYAGYQWRLYLDMIDAQSFRWNVFEMKPVTKAERTYRISSFHILKQYRYPSLASDVQSLVSRYVEFALDHQEVMTSAPRAASVTA